MAFYRSRCLEGYSPQFKPHSGSRFIKIAINIAGSEEQHLYSLYLFRIDKVNQTHSVLRKKNKKKKRCANQI